MFAKRLNSGETKMSWWTWVDFAYIVSEEMGDAREFDVKRARPEIEEIVDAQGYHHHVATDMCELLAEKQAAFKINSFGVMALFSALAARFPDVSFAIRGRGEDIRDVWIREFVGGKNTFAFGPPEGFAY
jgi:hypothetical protein